MTTDLTQPNTTDKPGPGSATNVTVASVADDDGDDGDGPTEATDPTEDETTDPDPGFINDCNPAESVDLREQGLVEINSVGLGYDLSCIRVSPGTLIVLNSDFAAHPLRGGIVVDGEAIPDASSPVPNMDTGDQTAFVVHNPGTYGYYCDFHYASGMVGAIVVE